eukprot:CAMPEP_0185268214 /NCGR_PEP_ID=MMETSP1359-20130426/36524_1 /TAXON_ID=552665 /ORGANISM="Bigelowiella longifila, Strain CCMP242" /LENGTH=416 /DNA_ID=CAMNT_0027858901 /DNA_START=187 /DNA_END=1437 /DNA_ORIENTATION=+
MGFVTNLEEFSKPTRRGRPENVIIGDQGRDLSSTIAYNMITDERIRELELKLRDKLGEAGAAYYLPKALETERKISSKPLNERNRRIMIAASNKKRSILKALGMEVPVLGRSESKRGPRKFQPELVEEGRRRLLPLEKVTARTFTDPLEDLERKVLYKHQGKKLKDKVLSELGASFFTSEIISEHQLENLETVIKQRCAADVAMKDLAVVDQTSRYLSLAVEHSNDYMKNHNLLYLREIMDEAKEYRNILKRIDLCLPSTASLISLVNHWKSVATNEKVTAENSHQDKLASKNVHHKVNSMILVPNSETVTKGGSPLNGEVAKRSKFTFESENKGTLHPRRNIQRRSINIQSNRKAMKQKLKSVESKPKSTLHSGEFGGGNLHSTSKKPITDDTANDYLIIISEALLEQELVKQYA